MARTVIKRPLSIHGPTAPERKWRQLLKRWHESGLGGRAFSRRQGVRESAFRFWLREIPERIQRRKAVKMPVRMLPARVISAPRSIPGTPLEVLIGHRCTVRVGSGFDPALLLQIIRALETSP